jgi:predicted metal-dependent hydrolase
VLEYGVRKHRRARSASVRVNRQDGVLVTLPWRVPYRVLPSLLAEWEEWLLAQAEKFGVWNGPVVREFTTGSEVYVLGRLRKLNLVPLAPDRSRTTSYLEDESLTLGLSPSRILDPRADLEKTLRRMAREDLETRVDRWAAVVGRTPTRMIVGERRSRWGSCSRRGALSFCYRLVMAPPATIDAVVAHELCHLVHLNHSPRFYALLDRVCPGHREAMAWLAEHHTELLL